MLDAPIEIEQGPGQAEALTRALAGQGFDWLFSIANLAIIPDDVLGMYPISTTVNNVRNEGPELLQPIEERDTLFE